MWMSRFDTWMQRTISFLALLALLFGLLPPATCLGIGRACCCASPMGASGAPPEGAKPGWEPAALAAVRLAGGDLPLQAGDEELLVRP